MKKHQKNVGSKSQCNNSLSLVVPRRRWIWSGRILALRRPQHQHPHLWGEQDFCVLSTWPTRWRQPSSSSSTACLATSGRCSTGATRWQLKPSLHAIDCSHSSIINSLCLWTWTMNVHISRRTHNLHSTQRFANKKHCKKKWSNFQGDGIFSPGGSLSNMYGMMLARHQAFPDIKVESIILSYISTNKTIGL